MNRRRFLNTVALASAARPIQSAVEVEVIRPKNPFEAVLRDIDPGHDEFPLEKHAAEIVFSLRGLLNRRSLPFAERVAGSSPMPKAYRAIAKDVAQAEFDRTDTGIADGLKQWLDALGPVSSARFFVLPDNVVRFEIVGVNRYRVGTWKQVWIDGRVTRFEPIEETVTSAPQTLFQDVTAHAFQGSDSFARQLRRGVNYWRANLDAASGIDVHGHNGIAVGDIDSDGFDEIYVCQPGGLPNRLYRNRGDGVLDDITDQAGVGILDATSSALFLDLRNSGLQDLVALRPEGPLLFLNEGQSRFRFEPGAFQFQTAPQGSFTGMAAADYNRDGRLDLYLCTYSFFRDGSQYRYPTPYFDARNGPANYLFRNEPSGKGISFRDVTDAAGLNQNNNRFSFAPAWCDYNGDGWPDLYVANDFGRNNLYRNQNGHFQDVAAEAGVEDVGDGMSASWFDYDGDGKPDLYVSNMWSDAGQRINAEKKREPEELWRRHAKGNSLFHSNGDGTFAETGAAEGVEMGRWAWSSGGFDFDNDGQPEIFITSGMLTNESETDLESFFWRKIAAASPRTAQSEAKYEEGWNALSQAVHEKYSEAGRQPNVFYARRNGRFYDFSGVSGLDVAEDGRAFAVLDFEGDGNLDLVLKSRTGPQVRVFRNRSTEGRRAIALRLRGAQSNRDAIGARVQVDGQAKWIEAGSGYLSQHTKTLHFGLGEQDSARGITITWPSGLVQRFQDLAAGLVYEITEGESPYRATPFRIRTEISAPPVTGENSVPPSDTWLLDPVPSPAPIERPAFVPITANSPEAALCRQLFDLRRDVKLPAWLLVDEQSRVRKIVFSQPDPSDFGLLHSGNAQARALPFPGRFYTPPARNFLALGAALLNAGYPEQSLLYLNRAPQQSEKVLFAIGRVHLMAGRWAEAGDYLDRGLKLAPDSADAWNNLGSVKAARGNFRDAIAAYQKALSLQPGMTAALVNQGQAWVATGDFPKAFPLYQTALELNPRDYAAANLLGELRARQGQDAEAKQWFERSMANRRDYAPAIGNLGALYLRAGQTADAIAAFRYGIGVAPDEPSFPLHLASLYAARGDTETAREILSTLLSRNPRNRAASQALQSLETYRKK